MYSLWHLLLCLSKKPCLVPSHVIGNSVWQIPMAENIHLFPNFRICPTSGVNDKDVTTSEQVLPHVCARLVSHDQRSHFLLTMNKKIILEVSFQWDIPEFQNILEGEVTFVYSSRNRTKDVALFPWVKTLGLENMCFPPPLPTFTPFSWENYFHEENTIPCLNIIYW